MRRLNLLMVIMVVVGLLGPIAVQPRAAHALCVENSNMLGTWNNVDPATRGIRQVRISFECGDVVLCDESGNCTVGRTGHLIQVFGACHPTSCDWGWADATFIPSTRVLTAAYDHGFATRRLSARIITIGARAGQLRLAWATHFTDSSGRADYSRVEYFRR